MNTEKFLISDFKWPDPECKIERIDGEAAYRCINPNCKSRVMGMLEHFCSKNAMNIEGMGPQIIKQLLEAGLLKNFDDIYKIGYKDLIDLDRFKDKSAINLINSINQSKQTTFPRFLFGLGIPNVGQHISKVIDKYCNSSLEKLAELKIEEMIEIDGIGETVAMAIEDYFNNENTKSIIESCLQLGVEIVPTTYDTSTMRMLNKKIVITGSFESLSRSDLKLRLENLGATVSSSVSTKTDIVIVGKNPGSKLSKAQDLNVKIVYEKDLVGFLSED